MTGLVGTVARARSFSWGFVSQAASSATNLGLSLIAARRLGPDGLGALTIGYTYYLFALVLQRALVTEPFIAASSAADPQRRDDDARRVVSITLAFASVSLAILLAASFAVGGAVGHGLLLFAPWLPAALLQDLWRSILFRDGRGKEAATNDLVWAVVMAAMVPVAFAVASPWAVVSGWGGGAVAGALLGIAQLRLAPAAWRASYAWWRAHVWPTGRWLGIGTTVANGMARLFVFLLPAIVGTAAIGGLRAAQVVFGPITLIGPALALPGLPAITARARESHAAGRRLAARIGAAAAIASAGYVFVAALIAARLLSWVFGTSFAGYSDLLWPIGIGQVLVAPAIGFNLYLVATGRARALSTTQIAGSSIVLAAGLALAVSHGIVGAAWGASIGNAVQALAATVVAFRSGKGETRDEVPGLLDDLRSGRQVTAT